MEITDSNIMELELSINNLIQQKSKLVFDKKEIDLKNSTLANKVRTGGRMHNVKYKQICDEQNKCKKEGLKIEKAISLLSIEILKKTSLRDQLKSELKKLQKIDVKKQLIDMRDYYINFASDKTRVSSMRAMGAEFAEKVEALIKSL